MAVEIWAKNATKRQISHDKGQFPRAFLEDLCCALDEKSELTAKWKGPSSKYGESFFPYPAPLRKDGSETSLPLLIRGVDRALYPGAFLGEKQEVSIEWVASVESISYFFFLARRQHG
jgi:hypothetical protein